MFRKEKKVYAAHSQHAFRKGPTISADAESLHVLWLLLVTRSPDLAPMTAMMRPPLHVLTTTRWGSRPEGAACREES